MLQRHVQLFQSQFGIVRIKLQGLLQMGKSTIILLHAEGGLAERQMTHIIIVI